MSELAFCKSFLTALDARPAKLSSDHIADARHYPAHGAYILPRLAHPPHPTRPNPKMATSTSTSSTLTICLKPMKPTHPVVPLSNVDASKTSIYDLKSQYATETSIPAAKIKILYKKKPASDSKTVGEVIGQEATGDVELGVMIMGGAVASPATGTPVTSPPAAAPSEADKGLAGASTDGLVQGGPAAVGPSGKDVVATNEFWSDLKNFIMQRTKDETEAERLAKVFREAWESSK